MNKFQLDIITPISIDSHNNVSYLRIPALDGLTGIKARHAAAIIALKIGEVKVVIDGKEKYFSTSGGYTDIQSESVQLLLESFEELFSSLLPNPPRMTFTNDLFMARHIM